MALSAKQKRESREQSLRDEGAAAERAKTGAPPPAPNADIQKLNEAAFKNPGAVPDAKGRIATPQSAGAKVTVACKLGVAYYDIQLCVIEDKFEQNLQGGRTIREATRVGPVVRLRGKSYPRGTPPKDFPAAPEIMNEAALTRGVDKAWFDEWLKQNARNPIVMNKMIFAAETDDALRGESAELSQFLSGLEPIDPSGDSRIPRSTRKGTGPLPEVSDIEPGRA